MESYVYDYIYIYISLWIWHLSGNIECLIFMLWGYQYFVPWTGFEVSKDPRRWLAQPLWVIHPSMCSGPGFWAGLSSGSWSPCLSWNELMWQKGCVPGWELEKAPSARLPLGVASGRQSDGIRRQWFTEGRPTNLLPEKAETTLAGLWNLSGENIGHFHQWRWIQLSQENNNTDPCKSTPGAC